MTDPRGTDRFYYSAQKAELEALLSDLLGDSTTDAYIFRPCIVSGPSGGVMMDNIPYLHMRITMPRLGAKERIECGLARGVFRRRPAKL